MDERILSFCTLNCGCPALEDMQLTSSLNQAIERMGLDRVVELPDLDPPDSRPIAQLATHTCSISSSCNKHYRCPPAHSRSPPTSRCICRVKPGVKGGWASRSCGVQARQGFLNGKRSEPSICPCNGTYVSVGCCDVDDGLVWEPPEMKLGEMEEEV